MIAQKRQEKKNIGIIDSNKQQQDWDDDHSECEEPEAQSQSESQSEPDLNPEESELLATVKESERLKTLIIGEVLKSVGANADSDASADFQEDSEELEEDRHDMLMSTLTHIGNNNRVMEPNSIENHTEVDELDVLRKHTAALLQLNPNTTANTNNTNNSNTNSDDTDSDSSSEVPPYEEFSSEASTSVALEYSEMLTNMQLVLDLPVEKETKSSKQSSATTTKTTNSNSNSEENAIAIDSHGNINGVMNEEEDEEEDDFFEEDSPVSSDASDASGSGFNDSDDLLGEDMESESESESDHGGDIDEETSRYYDCEEISEDLISTRKAEADHAEILLNEYESMMEVQLKNKQNDLQQAIHKPNKTNSNDTNSNTNDSDSSVELEALPVVSSTSASDNTNYLNKTTTGTHLSSIASSKQLIKKKRLELEILELKHELLLQFSQGKLERACELLITIDHNDDDGDDVLLSGIEKILGVEGLKHLDEMFKLITLQTQYDTL